MIVQRFFMVVQLKIYLIRISARLLVDPCHSEHSRTKLVNSHAILLLRSKLVNAA